jgi:nitroimidazol reductase NimA-like FMN-containing flavoprotein (pyridoxamine 5'-phosphate oxidase superfamily)
MSTSPTSTKNLDGYGAPEIPWERVASILDGDLPQAPGTGGPDRHTSWLTTVRPDGRPHVAPVGALYHDGAVYVCTGKGTRKGRNLAGNPACAVSIATHPFDLVVEGEAVVVDDPDELEQVAATYREGGWPCQVEGDAITAEYSAPAAGKPPWHVYRVDPRTVFAHGTAEPYGSTRFDL